MEKQAAVLGRAQAQAALFPQPLLVAVVTRGVDRVLVMEDLLVKLAWRVLLGQGQEPGFLKALAQLLRCPPQGPQEGESYLPPLHGLTGWGQPASLSPYGQRVPNAMGVNGPVEELPFGGR